jgi:hypothetical protein
VLNGGDAEEESSHHACASFLFKVAVVVAVFGLKFPPLSVVTQLQVYSFLHEAMEIRATPTSITVIFFMR